MTNDKTERNTDNNHHRLHASLDMMTPDQAHTQKGVLKKHWKSRYATKKELLQHA